MLGKKRGMSKGVPSTNVLLWVLNFIFKSRLGSPFPVPWRLWTWRWLLSNLLATLITVFPPVFLPTLDGALLRVRPYNCCCAHACYVQRRLWKHLPTGTSANQFTQNSPSDKKCLRFASATGYDIKKKNIKRSIQMQNWNTESKKWPNHAGNWIVLLRSGHRSRPEAWNG
jgi:hypothetical protein